MNGNSTESGLPRLTRATLLCKVALAVGRSDPQALRRALVACQSHPALPLGDVEEALLQGIPFSGFPGAVEALGAWRALGGGVSTVEETPPPTATHGAAVFERVYGEVAPRVRLELAQRHPLLERWIIEFAYGRVMGRARFELALVEALGIASLLGQGRLAPLHSHLRGALRTGWSARELSSLLDALAEAAPAPALQEARRFLARFENGA